MSEFHHISKKLIKELERTIQLTHQLKIDAATVDKFLKENHLDYRRVLVEEIALEIESLGKSGKCFDSPEQALVVANHIRNYIVKSFPP